jgi:hypothetical protein
MGTAHGPQKRPAGAAPTKPDSIPESLTMTYDSFMRNHICRRKMVAAFALLSPALALLAGCGQDTVTVPVSGQITYQGKPVDRGRITFEPVRLDDPNMPSRPSIAPIKPDGSFVLSTFQASDGVQPGEYRVVIWSVQNEPGDEDWAHVGTTFDLGWLVPEKYGYSKSTPLTATVPAGKRVELNFELTD